MNASICFGATYTLPSGKIAGSSGLHRDTIRYVYYGCDSLISNITLSVGQPVRESKTLYICQGQSFTLPGGRVVNTTGIYPDAVRSAGGCDSLISSIDLQVQLVKKIDSTAFVCDGNSFRLPSGKQVNSTAQYADTLRYTTGCDSMLYVVRLTVFPTLRDTKPVSICFNTNYSLPSGKIVNSSGLYRDTIRYTNGCDSLISNITLTVGQPLRESKTAFICLGQSYHLPSGRVVSSSATYLDTVRTSGGCDSLISAIQLVVDQPVVQSLAPVICANALFTSPSGKAWSVAGSYADTLRNRRGCDSVHYSIVLAVKQVSLYTVDTTICQGQTIALPGGNRTGTTGTYIDTLQTALGCDSIITTRLTVRSALQVTVSSGYRICQGNNALITATASGGNGSYIYTWGNGSIGNSIQPSPLQNTPYTVTVTDGCTVQPATASATILVTPLPDSSFSVNSLKGCAPFKASFTNAAAQVSHYWNFGTGVTADTSALQLPSFTYTQPGNYTVRLLVKTPDGCAGSTSQNITVYAKPELSITAPATLCINTTAAISSQVVNGSNPVFVWKFGNGQTSALQNPASQSYANAGPYSIELLVKDENGCADTAIHSLTVYAL
ncbi:MAG TPA: PKD domain-containing protein, partial [Methylotenera sp.]|nr:PKD domain-containing protein [Methylotenera sp.]